jgi:hypothetical protein
MLVYIGKQGRPWHAGPSRGANGPPTADPLASIFHH